MKSTSFWASIELNKSIYLSLMKITWSSALSARVDWSGVKSYFLSIARCSLPKCLISSSKSWTLLCKFSIFLNYYSLISFNARFSSTLLWVSSPVYSTLRIPLKKLLSPCIIELSWDKNFRYSFSVTIVMSISFLLKIAWLLIYWEYVWFWFI